MRNDNTWRGRKLRSDQQEKRTAKRYGATLHAGSGSGKYKRNDSHTAAALIENKRTDNEKSIRVVLADLVALAQRADAQGRRPEMHIEINGDRYVILREDDHVELCDGAA